MLPWSFKIKVRSSSGTIRDQCCSIASSLSTIKPCNTQFKGPYVILCFISTSFDETARKHTLVDPIKLGLKWIIEAITGPNLRALTVSLRQK